MEQTCIWTSKAEVRGKKDHVHCTEFHPTDRKQIISTQLRSKQQLALELDVSEGNTGIH